MNDGLGDRCLIRHPHRGLVETLNVRPQLVERPGAEVLIGQQAVRLQAARVIACTHLVERHGAGVRVISEHPVGLRLSVLLRHMEQLPGHVPDTMVICIARALAQALAELHQLPGRGFHGVLSAEHVVLTPDGSAILTDAALGTLLPTLEYGHRRLWSAFGIILPASAGPPRFDQRADVAQMAGVILQLAIGRRLSAADGLRLPELVGSVMLPAGRGGLGRAAQFRGWLYRALQLPSRGLFVSAVDASEAFAQISGQIDRQEELRAIRALVNEVAGQEGRTAGACDARAGQSRSA